MFRKILAPTDLSEVSTRGLAIAGRWARALGAELTILHVDEDFESGMHDGPALVKFLADVESQRHAALEAARQRAELESHRTVKVLRRRGVAATEIRAVAREGSFDLVVLLTQAESGLRRLFGSTARRLSRDLPCATLMLTETSARFAEQTPDIERVLYPTDFSDPSVQGLRPAAQLAAALGASMEVMHVLQLPTFVPGVPGEPALALPHEISTEREQRFRNKLDELCATIQGVHIDYRVTIAPTVAPAIADSAERYDFHLVCLPAQGHGMLHNVLFGSVAEATIEASARPVLVFPPHRTPHSGNIAKEQS